WEATTGGTDLRPSPSRACSSPGGRTGTMLGRRTPQPRGEYIRATMTRAGTSRSLASTREPRPSSPSSMRPEPRSLNAKWLWSG
ncbi:uncharacterized protein J3R85_004765, partial [Psidium guajava]